MKILMINSVPYGSPAKIMYGIAEVAESEGYETLTATGYSSHPAPETPASNILISGFVGKSIHMMLARFTGKHGCYSLFNTLKFLQIIKREKPDIIHLHNLHGWYIHLPLLFRYIKKHRIRVMWTLHDCWSFTGQCPYFSITRCDKWKTGCHNCPSYREYPQSYVDMTKKMWHSKRQWFTGVEDLTIVTPSQWLADLVKESYLKEYPVKVIHNGIDLKVYRPTEGNIREKYGIPQDRKVILGVALGWGLRKGLDVFVELAHRLPEEYQIVLVGTDANVDTQLPGNIISIHRTQNQQELAEIYTTAALFVNPTREENYPTVNMEAIACGTPVVTFNTGGSPEILSDGTGSVVPYDDVDALEKEILRICGELPYSADACCSHAENFDRNQRFLEYVNLYK